MSDILHPKASWLVALFLISLPPLAAQQVLYVEHDGSFHHVRNFAQHYAYIEDNGKLIPAEGHRYTLEKTAEYLPVFVSVRGMKAAYRSADMDGQTINKAFSFEAEFESPYALDHAFIVLELISERAGKFLFPYELGMLKPHEPNVVSLTVPITEELGTGKFHLHVFTDGREVFNSQIPVAVIEGALDGMVAKRIVNVQEAMPKPLVGPAPEYPAKLRKAGIKGEAKVSFVISPHGRVLKAEIKSASDPAFGEAALAAIRQWRFLPKIKEGRAVETMATLPFVFSPPEKSAAKS